MSDAAKLDPELQQQILQAAGKAYPNRVNTADLPEHPALHANLRYLDERGMIDALDLATFDDATAIGFPRITAVGLDLLAA